MPTYEYRCNACNDEIQIFHGINESAKRKCPSCGKLKLVRLISGGGGIIFKGSGFYETDYKRKGEKRDDKPTTDAPKKSETKKETSTKSDTPKTEKKATPSKAKKEK